MGYGCSKGDFYMSVESGKLSIAMNEYGYTLDDDDLLELGRLLAVVYAAGTTPGGDGQRGRVMGWKCPECGESLEACMDVSIRCKNGHRASGPWDVFLSDLLEAKGVLSEAAENAKKLASDLERFA